MADASDMVLLRDYHRQGSEEAFAGLVQRHINLVYSAAIRHVGIAAHAEEITQAVFIILARKAASLRSDIILESWLHETTRLTALSFLRGERRRQFREQEAYMQSTLQESADASTWNQLAPLLDEAVSRLGKKDRDALMLRFFKDKSLREVALALKMNEAAAQRRVLRAVEKLRGWFTKRGVVLPAAALTAAISANSVQAAPVGMAVTISAAAVKGAAVAASVSALVNETVKAIFMTTIQKTAIAVAIVTAAGTGIYETQQASILKAQVQALQQQQAPLTNQIQQLQGQRDEATRQLASLRDENLALKGNTDELLRLRGEVTWMRRAQDAAGKSANSSASKFAKTTEQRQAEADVGRELGLAVVRHEPGALDKLVELSKAEYATFRTDQAGLNDTARGELARQTFAPLHAAFKVIEEAAIKGDRVAIDAVVRSLEIPEVKGSAVQCLGTLAGNGNEDALEVLLNHEKYGFLRSSAVGALRPAAEQGNQRAIDALAAVTQDNKAQPLWYIAASGLGTAAAAGNPVAVDALVALAGSTNINVRTAVVKGLGAAAAKQNAKAAETLRSMGIQTN